MLSAPQPRRPPLVPVRCCCVVALVTVATLLVSLLPSGVVAATTRSLPRHRGALSAFLSGTGTAKIMQRPPAPRSLGICHTFAGLAIDRSRVVELKEPSAFEDALRRPDSTFVLFHGTNALVKYAAADAAPAIAYHSSQELAGRLGIALDHMLPRAPPPPTGQKQEQQQQAMTCVALGAAGDDDGPQWVFALDVSARPKEELEATCTEAMAAPTAAAAARVAFEPVRGLLASMTGTEIALCGRGAAILAWHRLNQYCGVCGSPMHPVEAGGRRACTSCRNRAYPRIDPVCIALVYDPATDRCLLGRQRVYRPGMFSCLAGYAEQCESLEEAVRREVKEESGIDVGKVQFHSSQPWPIGRGASCQLMVGFVCEATSTIIAMDGEELEDVRWFTREEVAAAKELVVTPLSSSSGGGGNEKEGEDGTSTALSIPGPYAIAHHLIRHWLQMPPRHRL